MRRELLREAKYPWASICTVRRGRVISYRVYEDTAALVAAFTA